MPILTSCVAGDDDEDESHIITGSTPAVLHHIQAVTPALQILVKVIAAHEAAYGNVRTRPSLPLSCRVVHAAMWCFNRVAQHSLCLLAPFVIKLKGRVSRCP